MDQPFQYGLSEDWLRVVASKALEVSAPGDEAYQLSLAVTCDETVRSLNRDYRGLDEITDVLSFLRFPLRPIGKARPSPLK